MTAAEKTSLYTFLITSQGWISGYKTETPIPTFTDSPNAAEVAQKSAISSLKELDAAITACQFCSLSTERKTAVSGEGPETQERIHVMVIADTPGIEDDHAGLPFTGKEGQLLDKMLSAINLSRTNTCYMTHLVKCRPLQNREPGNEERLACSGYLNAQIALIRPFVILVLGESAAQYLLETTEIMKNLRGRFFTFNGIPLMSTYHPSTLLQDETLKRPVWEDLKLFRTELDRLLGQ